MGIPDEASVGRFKITGVQPASGVAGVFAMMEGPPLRWDTLQEVNFWGDGRAIVHATGSPPVIRGSIKRALGFSA